MSFCFTPLNQILEFTFFRHYMIHITISALKSWWSIGSFGGSLRVYGSRAPASKIVEATKSQDGALSISQW